MEVTIPLPFMFFEAKIRKDVEEILETEDGDNDRRILACADCKAKITTQGARTAVKGGHEHNFFNPHGIIYRIGCFRNAPGCMPTSQPTAEFSWFPGYRWRIVCCSSCLNHLGWSFEANHTFFGLILNRLVELEEEKE